MSKFSERIGAVQATLVLQLDSISEPLRNSVWNFLHSIYGEGESGWREPAETLSQWFFKVPVDELPIYNLRRRDWIKARFFELEWHQAYDFIEFISDYQGRRRYTSFTKDAMHRVVIRIASKHPEVLREALV